MRVEKYFLEVDNKGRVQKIFSIFSFLISRFPALPAGRSFQKGFTLIEMLVVFAIMGSLTVVGVNSFFSYSRNQDFRTAVSDVTHTLNDLKSRAISQVKPSECGSAPLEGYQFWFPNPGTSYRISVRCGGTYYPLTTKKLPANVTFDAASTDTTFFNARTGTVDSVSTIIITGYDKTSTISVNTTGVISVQ